MQTYRIFDLRAVSAANNACKDASRFILGLSESTECVPTLSCRTLRMSVRNVAFLEAVFKCVPTTGAGQDALHQNSKVLWQTA